MSRDADVWYLIVRDENVHYATVQEPIQNKEHIYPTFQPIAEWRRFVLSP